jgi:hypothetical protein
LEVDNKVEALKKQLKEATDIMVLQGLELGAIDVGEASSVMHKGKDPTEIPPAENGPRKILSTSRNKRSHKIGSDGTSDGEFEFVVNGTKSIFRALRLLLSTKQNCRV